MKIETLKQKGKLIIGIIITITLISTVIFYNTSIKGKHTLKRSTNDQLMAVYIDDGSGTYTKASDGKIPASGYTLNTDNTKTRCTVSGEIDSNVKISYENGEVKVGEVTKSGTRCYFYFDKVKGITTDDSMFAGITGNGVYTWTKGDYSGGTKPIKYFRGDVSNNWVVFGKDGSNYIWWRIIRNNSNGSLRMIYAGTSASKTSAPATTGTGTGIGISAFNSTATDNMYVGFKYTNGEIHGTGTASTILGETNSTDATTLYGWYNTKLKTNYGSYIDIDVGFCNDRTITNTGTVTYYAAYTRLYGNKAPSLLCTDANDIFKTNVGLITADEVQMAGMVWNSPTNTTYLYTNTNYWTMSPYYFYNGKANVFAVNLGGYLSSFDVYVTFPGVRPVINLKSSILFEEGGTGLANNPYVVCD